MLRRPLLRPVFSAMLVASLAPSAMAAEPLRLKHLYRCEDVLDSQRQTFCLTASGVSTGQLQVLLDGKPLPASAVKRGDELRITLESKRYQSCLLYTSDAADE